MAFKPKFTLLNTRPDPKAAADLRREVEAVGGEALDCPTLRIVSQPVTWEVIQKLASAPLWIVTSAQAVSGLKKAAKIESTGGEPSVRPLLPKSPIQVLCIGQATQKAFTAFIEESQSKDASPFSFLQQTISRCQIIVNPQAQSFHSEELLAHPLLQSAASLQKLALLKGKGGRELLQTVLIERGFHVELVELYQRQPAPFCAQAWLQWRQSERPLLLASSFESVQSLCQQVDELADEQASAWLRQQRTIVYSQRIANLMAEQLAWQGKMTVVPPGNANVIKALRDGATA